MLIQSSRNILGIVFAALIMVVAVYLSIGPVSATGPTITAPQNLRGESQQRDDSLSFDVTLRWDEYAPPGGFHLIGYVISKRPSGNPVNSRHAIAHIYHDSDGVIATTYTHELVQGELDFTYSVQATVNNYSLTSLSDVADVEVGTYRYNKNPDGLELLEGQDGEVILTWTFPHRRQGGLAGFRIMRRETDSGGDYKVLVENTGSPSPAYRYVDWSAETGFEYEYAIRAIAHKPTQGITLISLGVANGTIIVRPLPPGNITSLHPKFVSDGDFIRSANYVSWTPVESSYVTGYWIYRRIEGREMLFSTVGEVDSTTSEFYDYTAPYGHDAQYSVASVVGETVSIDQTISPTTVRREIAPLAPVNDVRATVTSGPSSHDVSLMVEWKPIDYPPGATVPTNYLVARYVLGEASLVVKICELGGDCVDSDGAYRYQVDGPFEENDDPYDTDTAGVSYIYWIKPHFQYYFPGSNQSRDIFGDFAGAMVPVHVPSHQGLE